MSTCAVAAAFLVVAATPAIAHRDGCHSHHSCPSDTGSYVCGDTGNFSECGYGPGDLLKESATSSGPPADLSAPDAPKLAAPSARAGEVTVPLSAEAGSRIDVLDTSGSSVATAGATGAEQVLTFRAADGSSTYTVTATDPAGNTSTSARFNLTIDAAPPAAPTVSPTAATGGQAYTVIAISGEQRSQYALRVERRGDPSFTSLNQDGVLASAEKAIRLLAPNGEYDVSVLLTDEAGNSAPPVSSYLVVDLPAPTLALERTSALNKGDVVLQFSGPALGTGTVDFTADGVAPVSAPFTLDEAGIGAVTVALADSSWIATGTVTDFQQRVAAAQSAPLLVDTIAPLLTASFEADKAKLAAITVAFEVEPRTRVIIDGLPGGERRVDREGPQQITESAADGDYQLTLTAIDDAGNETVQRLAVRVTHPLTRGEVITALAILGLIVAGTVLVARTLWRRRDRFVDAKWDRRAKRAKRRLQAAHTVDIRRHESTLAAYQRAVVDHQRDSAAWEQVRRRLRAELAESERFSGGPEPLPVKPKPGERVFARCDGAGLVEIRKPQGVETLTLLEYGTLWVSDRRVLFEGSDKNREWSFDRLTAMSHVGADTTLMQVTNRQKTSGITYPGVEAALVRRRIDLALAEFEGRRTELAAAARERLELHEQKLPMAPAAPPEPPVSPDFPTAEQLRRSAGHPPRSTSNQTPAVDAVAPNQQQVRTR